MTDSNPAKAGGKGRPTPKRGSQKRRAPSTAAPTSKREAYKKRKAELRDIREAQKAALRRGDERAFPRFAKGDEKAAVRDAVDSRMGRGWLIYPGLVINLASLLVPNVEVRGALSIVSLVIIASVVADGVSVVRRTGKLLRARFPDGTKEPRRQLQRYAIARNTQFRSRRLPPPRVDVGTKLKELDG